MNTSPVTSEERPVEATAAGSIATSIGGLAAIILAIVGLVHIAPTYVLAIAALVVGAALVFQGGDLFAQYSGLLAGMTKRRAETAPVGGMGIEMLAGLVGIVLGILALVTVSPSVLLPIAVIVFGVALIGSSGDVTQLYTLKLQQSGADDNVQRMARESLALGSSTQTLIGLGGVVLGIVALVGLDWTVLSLVALLAFGIAVLVNSTGVTDRMMTFFHA
jgi:hypothetical protein